MKGARQWERVGAGSVSLQIERLVLDGFSLNAAQTARLQSTVEYELGRMLTGTSTGSWSGSAASQLQAAPVHLAPGKSPAVWGRQIARTLFATFAPPAPATPPPKIQTKS